MGQVVRNNEQFETNIRADHRGQLLKVGPDSGRVDAFGRARISDAFTLFDSVQRYDKRADQWNETVSGSATSVHSSNESSTLMTVAASGESVLRRTRKRFPYQPGKSLMVMQSMVMAEPAENLVQEVGLFDDADGMMVRTSGTTVQFVIRSNATGSVVENVVDQNSWNIDTFSALDISKAQILVFDLEWLGVGRVRMGFVIDGEIHYCHEFNHANSISSVYMTKAMLPLSYRIAATDTPDSSATLRHICASILSEGGYEAKGPVFSITPPLDSIPNTSGERIVAGIRMVSGRTDNVIKPAKIDLVTEDDTTIQWRLRLNPTTSGVSWAASDNGRGNVQTTYSGAIVSGGSVLDSGLFSSAGSVELDLAKAVEFALGVDNAGSSDELFLTVASSGNAKATGMLGWIETV